MLCGSRISRILAAPMGCDPRVWVGKGDRPCLLVVTCSGCARPSFVADPDGAQMAACAFCGVTAKAPDEAVSAWEHHKSVCKCGRQGPPVS